MANRGGSLTLGRKLHEVVYLRFAGVEVAVQVTDIDRGKVRLMFTAPQGVEIFRAELDPKRNNLGPEASQ